MRKRLHAWLLEKNPNGSDYLTLCQPYDPETGQLRAVPVPIPPAQSPRMTQVAHQIHSRRASGSVSSPPPFSTHQAPASTPMGNCPVWPASPERFTNRASSREKPRSLPGNYAFMYDTAATTSRSNGYYQRHRSGSSVSHVSQSLIPSSRSSSISTMSSGCLSPSNPNYPTQPFQGGISSQPRTSYHSTSSVAPSGRANTSYRNRSSTTPSATHRGSSHQSHEESFQNANTSISRLAPSNLTVEINYPLAKVSTKDLRNCLQPIMHIGRDFKIIGHSKASGSGQACLEFCTPLLAEQAARRLCETKIGGVKINVVHENTQAGSRRSRPSSEERLLRENATRTGPIIIDGSRTD